MRQTRTAARFALCVRTGGAVDLVARKVYRILPDRTAIRDGYLRIVDESGEDYLYPASNFVQVGLPPAVTRELEASTSDEGSNNLTPQSTGRKQRMRRASPEAARG